MEGQVHYRVVYDHGGVSLPYRKRSEAYWLAGIFLQKTAANRPIGVIRVVPKRRTDNV